MHIYLMRHGIAVAADDPSIKQDGDRPLTAKGTKRMRRAAQGLRRLKIPFDGILTSPLLRARQTAELVASALGKEARVEEIAGLAPESSVEQLLRGLTRYQDRRHLLLVGHEPLLSHTAVHLLGGQQPVKFTIELKKGSLCCIEIEDLPTAKAASLHWLLTPKHLRLLG
jgi:phosphohistidine phosphatase